MIKLRSTRDNRGYFGIHLYLKHPKLVKKWLRYGQFPSKTLHDYIENHLGQEGVLWYSFLLKTSKIGQEMAELQPFSL